MLRKSIRALSGNSSFSATQRKNSSGCCAATVSSILLSFAFLLYRYKTKEDFEPPSNIIFLSRFFSAALVFGCTPNESRTHVRASTKNLEISTYTRQSSPQLDVLWFMRVVQLPGYRHPRKLNIQISRRSTRALNLSPTLSHLPLVFLAAYIDDNEKKPLATPKHYHNDAVRGSGIISWP